MQIGRSHCVDFLPIKEDDGSVKYKIQDTWDSTSGYIGNWFVYKEENSKTKFYQTQISVFECGGIVSHPKFGKGFILKIMGSSNARIFEFGFEKVRVKKISEIWLRKMVTTE